ncbi:unnamed protein product [Rotaria socialis]|uniref:Uncharacterized protein n=1 Tax=Rotaria socialis TaxID=392032 RepID=A0A819UYQ1_9BILA|nr:unnamed protein product [Rotaria socialis]CAF3788449.1 unnamed protein product [Rotaria socialis]CAF4100617.1 unnamed protein product [Rotaria socialis]CAF4461481.1 unnamed protein product [Rotaria socialis]
MPREKHDKKKHQEGTTNKNENNKERSRSPLFTETDAQSLEVSEYSPGPGYVPPYTNQSMRERIVPTGVVDIDETVQHPVSPSKPNHQSKPYTVLQSRENHHKEHVHLPSINDHSHQRHQHHPYGYVPTSSDYHFRYLSNYNPVDHEYEPLYHNHQHSSHSHKHHHRHRHHHHHHQHHHHVKEIETYDPRWWYMPVNTVHGPKVWKSPEYHYVAPKWYESSTKMSRASMNISEHKLSPRKYPDCRCDVCNANHRN